MRIREVIWLKQFSEKIERKHQVYEEEVEEIFRKQPPVRWIGRGDVKGRIFMKRSDRPMTDVI